MKKTFFLIIIFLTFVPQLYAKSENQDTHQKAKKKYSLSKLDWHLTGYSPYEWKIFKYIETGNNAYPIMPKLKVKIPSSVQQNLLDNNIIPDWNIGINAKDCEWVENRHWIYETKIPDTWVQNAKKFTLNFTGLDYSGWIYFNGEQIATFKNTHLTHTLDITDQLRPTGNTLHLVFNTPPRWLGQIGYTSKMIEFKPRFNYKWDWCPRLVQIGIWNDITLTASNGNQINTCDIETDYNLDSKTGTLKIIGDITTDQPSPDIRLTLTDHNSRQIQQKTISAKQFNSKGIQLDNLKISPWWPNGHGEQTLYTIKFSLTSKGSNLDTITKTIGFKNVQWLPCEGAPKNATKWLLQINGKEIFIQGINWTPIKPNFADVTDKDYQTLIEKYKQIGVNLFRIWGGATLEKQTFYDICDREGFLVWQELPLSSSGLDNYPPDDKTSIETLKQIARSYIKRRKHHVSLLMWCGGNELRKSKTENTPLGYDHPLIKELVKVFKKYDPNRRFIPTTPLGPKFEAFQENYGKGLHWAVNGPWKLWSDMNDWNQYWDNDDSLIRTEVGCPSPSSVDVINKYSGNIDPYPATLDNPIWAQTPWWLQWQKYIDENGSTPDNLTQYVQWGQQRQADALAKAVKTCKDRFPACAGIIIWMGHDCFPCTANTAIIDYEHSLKPAAEKIKQIFNTPQNQKDK